MLPLLFSCKVIKCLIYILLIFFFSHGLKPINKVLFFREVFLKQRLLAVRIYSLTLHLALSFEQGDMFITPAGENQN